jgi:hypothetical protein
VGVRPTVLKGVPFGSHRRARRVRSFQLPGEIMRTLPSWIVACLLALPIAAHAQLNKCTGADGKVTYQSDPCPDTSKSSTVQPPPPAPESGAHPVQGRHRGQGENKSEGVNNSENKGWDTLTVARMHASCIANGRSYAKAAWARNPGMGPYPEGEITASLVPYCSCVVRRVTTTLRPDEFESKGLATVTAFTNEALAGGQCKPIGILGRALGF